MVYGRILFNNIKEYTPKWFATIPYSQTVKPTFGRKPQIAWNFTTSQKGQTFYKNIAWVFQRHSFLWQILLVAIAYVQYKFCRQPLLAFYKANNENRTYAAAMKKEKAHKKKLKDLEDKQSQQ